MKKTILIIGMAMLFAVGTTVLVGCGDEKTETPTSTSAEETHGEEGHAHYQCPMKCEGDKVYEEAVKCPKCGMDTKEV